MNITMNTINTAINIDILFNRSVKNVLLLIVYNL